MKHITYTALIPHGNVLSILLREQDDVLRSVYAKTGACFFRMMPLALFLTEPFEKALANARQNAVYTILPAVHVNNLVVYPMPSTQKKLCVPECLCIGKTNTAIKPPNGIITAFTANQSAHDASITHDTQQALLSGQHALRVNVYKLCAINFSYDDKNNWQWSITKTQWIKSANR
jgi:hypothetical protein